ncbi:MAG: hypothetical protein WCC57_18570, partial [Paracoccaceae bacterium]
AHAVGGNALTVKAAPRSSVTLVPSVYVADGQQGDFSWMLTQPQYARALFVFNDNEAQFLAFQSGISAGGGNAVIRPLQAATQRAAGIPTGPGYTSLTPHAQAMIDQSVAHIGTLLDTGAFDTLIYSASSTDPNMIGISTFQVADDVRTAIVVSLRALVA